MRHKVLHGNHFRKKPPNLIVVIDENKRTYSITSICFVNTHSQEAPTPSDCLLAPTSRKHQLPLFVDTYPAYQKHHVRYQPHGFLQEPTCSSFNFFKPTFRRHQTSILLNDPLEMEAPTSCMQAPNHTQNRN